MDKCTLCGSTTDVWYTLPGSPERPVCKRCAVRRYPPTTKED